MIINKAIIHILDKEGEAPILNDFESRAIPEVEAFFEKIIKKIMKDDDLRRALYNDYEENLVRNCTESIIYDESSFVKSSQEIAAYMFEVMSMNSDMESCDLAICLFTFEEEKFVAIFRLDYKKLFTHSVEFIDDKFNIQMVTNSIGIQESQKPKCACICGISSLNDEWHLRILDKEGEKKQEPTKWITEFLTASLTTDDKYNTKMFKLITDGWLTNNLSNDIKKSEAIRDEMNFILQNEEEISVEDFADNVIDDERLNGEYKELFEDREVDKSFGVDKDWVSKNLKRKSIITNNGFTLRGSITDFADPTKYSLKQNDDGTFDITVKNVEFYEVKK